MKKNLENFHEILSVSKHSHSEVGFILVISLGPEGVRSFADHNGVGGHRPPMGGRWLPTGGIRSPPCLANIEFGKADEVEQLPKWSRELPHGSFPRTSLWKRTNQNLELRNILSVRPPPIWKKQVAFKWIFRWFYAFWDHIFFFFLRKMTFSNPPTPLKYGKFRTFFFWNLPLLRK